MFNRFRNSSRVGEIHNHGFRLFCIVGLRTSGLLGVRNWYIGSGADCILRKYMAKLCTEFWNLCVATLRAPDRISMVSICLI
jgi:hypothetical protein